jgi:histidine triad (HIT) family protein
MEKCVFCQIVKGKLPSYKIYEDRDFLAFLDINPLALGHTLVIPKVHYRWVYDVPNFGAYWQVGLQVTQVLQKVLQPYFITYVTHGLEVKHAHIHIIPRSKNETAFIPKIKKITPDKLQALQVKISSAF